MSSPDPAQDSIKQLLAAVRKGDVPLVSQLLQAKADVNARDKKGYAAIHEVSDGATLQLLLDNSADINMQLTTSLCASALHLACHKGAADLVQMLLAAAADPSLPASDESRPLHLACAGGHAAIVQHLLAGKAAVNAAGKSGFTALHVVAEKANAEEGGALMQMLLQGGADVNVLAKQNVGVCHYAIDNGAIWALPPLLEAGVNANLAASDGTTALHLACEYGDIGAATLLLEARANPNCLTNAVNRALAPLHLAVKDAHVEITRQLLIHGAHPNLTSKDGSTSLHVAIQTFDDDAGFEVIKLLVQSKCDVNIPNKQGYTCMALAQQHPFAEGLVELLERNKRFSNAVAKGDLAEAKRLSGQGCIDVNWADIEGYTAIHEVVISVDVQMLNFLLDKNANLNQKEATRGQTPLMLAVQSGEESLDQLTDKEEMVEMLLHAKCDTSLFDKSHCTALHHAAAHGNTTAISALLNMDPYLSPRDEGQRTPLLHAADKGKLAAVELLLSKGADIGEKDGQQRSALHLASKAGNPQLVQLLLDAAADLAAVDQYGASPLHHAAGDGQTEAAQLLLAAGAPVNMADVDGYSALHLCSENDFPDTVSVLIAAKANLNMPAENNWTPLHLAAAKGRAQVLKLLLVAGADGTMPDQDGKVPFELAQSWAHGECKELLESHKQ